MRSSRTRKVAYCGLTRALCITVMLLGYLVPFATYVVPAFAGALLMPMTYEYGQGTGFALFGAVSILSMFLVSDYEIVFMFIFVFGSYTVLKMNVDRLKNRALKIAVKVLYVNIALVISYGILLFIFPVAVIVNEFREYSYAFIALLVAMFNFTFLLYDRILEKFLVIYVGRFRKVIYGSNAPAPARGMKVRRKTSSVNDPVLRKPNIRTIGEGTQQYTAVDRRRPDHGDTGAETVAVQQTDSLSEAKEES